MAEAPIVHTARGEGTEVELSRAQQQAARRAAESRATIPDITVEAEIDLRAALAAGHGADALIVRACALALREQPALNASYRDARVERHGRVNVGVALPSADGVILATVLDADLKGTAEIAAERAAFAERALAGALAPPELAGATFTVHGPSLSSADRVSALVEPGQAAVLAAGAVRERAVVREGALAAAPTVWCALTADRRVLSAVQASGFLERVRALLEGPASLLG